ncbi:MAG: hypothetical protein GY711_17905 [bacterium]|nr:hypothetical protein [bacterium]
MSSSSSPRKPVRMPAMPLDSSLDQRYAPGGSRNPLVRAPEPVREKPPSRLSVALESFRARGARKPQRKAQHRAQRREDDGRQPAAGKLLTRKLQLPATWWLPTRSQLGLGVAFVLGALFWHNLEQPMTVRGSDRELVLTVDDLLGLSGGGALDADLERFSKVKSLFGGVELEYEYAPDGGPRLAFVTRYNRSEAAATDDFALTNVQTMIDWKLAGEGNVGLVPIESLDEWADQVRAFRVEVAGKPAGYSFAARLGDRTVYMALEDVALDDSDAIEDLLASVLDTVERSKKPR